MGRRTGQHYDEPYPHLHGGAFDALLITDALIVRAVEVVHIMSPTAAKQAVLNEHARVRDGRLVHPPDL